MYHQSNHQYPFALYQHRIVWNKTIKFVGMLLIWSMISSSNIGILINLFLVQLGQLCYILAMIKCDSDWCCLFFPLYMQDLNIRIWTHHVLSKQMVWHFCTEIFFLCKYFFPMFLLLVQLWRCALLYYVFSNWLCTV